MKAELANSTRDTSFVEKYEIGEGLSKQPFVVLGEKRNTVKRVTPREVVPILVKNGITPVVIGVHGNNGWFSEPYGTWGVAYWCR